MAVPALDTLRTGLGSWFKRKKSGLTDDPRLPLPKEQHLAVLQQIDSLEVALPHTTFLRQELAKAFESWCANTEAANVLIVLSRPVQPIAPVIEAVMADWNGPSKASQALLPCRHRPADPAAVPLMLTAVLERPLPQADSKEAKMLLTLSNLEQCFLRCIDGWSGIERLRQVVLERRDRFWLLGCNSWAWTFLDHVSQISSYFPEARSLPALDGPALKEWLAPVATGLGLNEAGPSAPGGPGPGAPVGDDAEANLWSPLAELSCGHSRIASELFVRALRLDPDNASDSFSQIRPTLPELPVLTDEDRYILHSLLIHGTMRRDHLAFGLGLPSHRLQPRIHWLLGEDIIEESAGELSVRPSHYPCLVMELSNNNFFTGEL